MLPPLGPTGAKDAGQGTGEDSATVRKRNVYVHPFHEKDPVELVQLVGADHVVLGFHYPHPAGMSDPVSFVDNLANLSDEDVAKVNHFWLVRGHRLGHVPACERASAVRRRGLRPAAGRATWRR